MKVAVCISGQPRLFEKAAPAILRFFSGYKVDFFFHSWDNITHRISGGQPAWQESVSVSDEEKQRMIELYKPKAFKFENLDVLDLFGSKTKFISWAPLFYSMMYANHLKKRYEVENNFKYDIVVKTRFDVIFPPYISFEIPPKKLRTMYITVYERMQGEYQRFNLSDTFFFGDSPSMDIACDFFRERITKSAKKAVGPGVLLNEYLLNHNIELIKLDYPDIILRTEAADLDPITDWERVCEIYSSYYN